MFWKRRRRLDEEQLEELRQGILSELAQRIQPDLAARLDKMHGALLSAVNEQLEEEIGHLKSLPDEWGAFQLEADGLIDKALRIERRRKMRDKRAGAAEPQDEEAPAVALPPPPPPPSPEQELEAAEAFFCRG